ncbi:ComEC/Rec2 family competence protein [Arthrobacter sp. A2-55]|uniref:ComEC/Rec2 family competence protein n=1 Tax=Arthrobacter sp. A2-55 TaxID=2897337 RepID=UPI0021CD9335|nr:ComEC/Rec2 family competence protein [Arthrobacter sp. A2-55]MCU6478755.1 ComEC/Rec2 family competence protein [Arthrobacter sp. A2-55]
MRAPDSRWARYSRAAVEGGRKEGAGEEPEPPTGNLRQRHNGVIPPAILNRLREARARVAVAVAAWAKEAGHAAAEGPPRRPDLRLVPAVAATWGGAIAAIGLPWSFSGAGAAGSALVVAATAVRMVKRRRAGAAALALMAAAACLGTLLAGVALRQYDRQHSPLAVAVARGMELTVEMEISSAPRPLESAYGPHKVIFDAVIHQATGGGSLLTGNLPVRVIAGQEWSRLPQGATVHTAGTVAPGALQDSMAGILRPATPPLDVRPGGAGPHFGASLAASAQRAWGRLSQDAAGLLPGMVMGDRSGQEPALGESMKTVGLTHLTAVSGSNCTLVLTMLMLALRTVHLPAFPSSAAAVLGLAGFVAVVGPDPSVLRAAVMGAVGCLAMVGGRPRRAGTLLSVSILVLLVADPWLSLDYAFILSVLATLGLHLVGRRCATWLGAWLPAVVAQAVAIPLAAQLFCAPVIVLLQPRLLLYTVPANMAAAPVVALVTMAGTVAMVLAPVVPALADACSVVAGAGSWWVAAVARWMAALPAASLPWPGGAAGLVLMAVLNVAVLGTLVALVERQRLAAALKSMQRAVPPRWRILIGFGPLTAAAALAAALWTAAVEGG